MQQIKRQQIKSAAHQIAHQISTMHMVMYASTLQTLA
jgi:hypothetical protein